MQERILCYLKTTHSLTESEYKYWLEMYTDQGLSELKDDVLYYGYHIPSIAQNVDRDGSVEIGTSLGRYPDFPPTPEPFLSCPSLF